MALGHRHNEQTQPALVDDVSKVDIILWTTIRFLRLLTEMAYDEVVGWVGK
jgi:hypothetical protein